MGLFFGDTHHHNHESHTTTRITEQRAPTDESVKLLMEMEKAAEKNFVKRIDVYNNIFNITYFEIAERIDLYYGKYIYYKFKLNGNDFSGQIKIDCDFCDERTILNTIFQDVSKEITFQLIDNSLKTGNLKLGKL